jgi:hypothetical protein
MQLKFECHWCGKERCDSPGEVCSEKCGEAEKNSKVEEVLAELDGDHWRPHCAREPLAFMFTITEPYFVSSPH